MTTFNRNNVEIFRESIASALNEVAERHGISVELGAIRFTEGKFTSKITALASGNPEEERQVDFNRYCSNFGIKPDAFHDRFIAQGTWYTVCGIKPRSRKYPIIARQEGTDKQYKFRTNALPAYMHIGERSYS